MYLSKIETTFHILTGKAEISKELAKFQVASENKVLLIGGHLLVLPLQSSTDFSLCFPGHIWESRILCI